MTTLSASDADALVRCGSVRVFASRQALGHEGQVADSVFILRSGCVKVCSTTADGKEVVLAVRGPRDLVGELSALDDRPRSASIIALEHVEAVVVSARSFRAFLSKHPVVALSLLNMLSRRLREVDAQRTEYVALNTAGRVALRIVELAERFGEPEGDAIELKLPLTQEELAGWTSASLESVGRALQMMRRRGWIETRPRQIRILDLEALRRAAE